MSMLIAGVWGSLGVPGIPRGGLGHLTSFLLLLYILLINTGGIMTGGIPPLYMVDVDFFTLMPPLTHPLAGD